MLIWNRTAQEKTRKIYSSVLQAVYTIFTLSVIYSIQMRLTKNLIKTNSVFILGFA